MNYEINYNYEYLPVKENLDGSNQILYLENLDINNNNYYNYNNNKISFYLDSYNNYENLYYKGDNLNINSIENNFYKKNKSPIIKRNIIKEEIKNIDSNDEYYKDYNFIPKQFNYDTTKSQKQNKIIKNIEHNNNNSLYDLIFPQNQNKTNIKILNYNLKGNDYCSISPCKKIINNNYLTNNQINNNNPSKKINQNSPIKKNLYYNLGNNIYNLERNYSRDKYKPIKIKKQIINKIADNLYNNNKNNNNENEDNKKMQKIHEEYKNNHINLIPIPSNLKKFSNNTYNKNKKKVFPFSTNFKPNQYENSSLKKNITNIDINTDFDKENQKNIQHKKNYSSVLGNSITNTDNNVDSCNINKKNNVIINDKTHEAYNYLNKNISEKNIFIERKKRSASKKKVKIQILNSNPDDIKNVYDLNANPLPKNFKIFWGGKSQAGKDSNGNIKINQDSFKVLENINNIKNFNIFILCDGHGKDGHHVSKFVTEYIISSISNNPLIITIKDLYQIYRILTEFNYKIIKEIFSETDNYLYNQQNFDTYVSGTTCVLILQIGNKIICANSGDSRAILINSTKNTNYNNCKNSKEINNTKIIPLSLDSKPDLPSEKQRIINSGGEVHKGKNRKGKLVGPMRVFAKGKDFPGLAMSRSLGDFKSKDFGVICEPSFVEYNLDEFCKYIVVCSDGVWDFMDNEKVMKIGNKHYLNNNPDGFCQEILGNASYWWEKEDIVIDDITALIVFFKFYY